MSLPEVIARHWRAAVLVCVCAGGLLGAVSATLDLYHGMEEADALYKVGVAGLSIESDLQRYTQESRRTFVYALTTSDPNIQLPYVLQARAADRNVSALYGRFAGLGLESESKELLKKIESEWHKYVLIRDEVISLILEGRGPEAARLERSSGVPAYETCATDLNALKNYFDAYAERQLAHVRVLYYRSAGKIVVLILAALAMMFALRKLADLRRTNQELTEAEKVERERSAVLELVSQNRALPEVLHAVKRLVERQRSGALCSISVLEADGLRCIAAADLPCEFVRERDLEFGELTLQGSDAIGTLLASEAKWKPSRSSNGKQVQACWFTQVRSSGGKDLGTVTFYVPHSRRPQEHETMLLMRTAMLVALAIEHRQATEQLAFQARHDVLTALPNRAMLLDQIEYALTSESTQGLAILWVDLDRFKQVNDSLGHQAGDELLREVARRLVDAVRCTDIVSRVGGDEFVLMLRDLEEEKHAIETAHRIVETLGRPCTICDHEVVVTASVGISLYPQHGRNAATLLRNADEAMYQAKFQGKNMFEVHDPRRASISNELLALETNLHKALDNGEFELHFQPQVSTSGVVEAVEALIRWNSPKLGRVSPAQFIPLAEENGAIVPLGNWVLRAACNQAMEWQRSGLGRIGMAVNISARQLVRPDFVAVVSSALSESGLDPSLLELELTETAIIHNLDRSIDNIARLRTIGVRFAIDDFGTGNSALSYLRQLPVDTLKVDRSFVSSLDASDHQSLSVVRAIIGIAQGLRLHVIAEGVETLEQLRIVGEEGCTTIQGFLFYRPMIAKDITVLLQTHRSRDPRMQPLESYSSC